MKTAAFKDHVAVVTGASSGIGKALALQLAAQGAAISLASRNAERLESLAAECRARGGSALAVPTDVSDEEQCRSLMDETIRQFGRLDMLINNAGISVAARLEQLPSLDLFRRVMDVNFNGLVNCTYYALPHLKVVQGRLVNVSSLAGKLAIPYNAPYVASKFAIAGFSDSLRMELQSAGVSVTVIFPYWVVTEFHERLLDKDGRARGKRGRAIYTEKTMTAEQCAQRILRAALRRRRELVMRPGPLAAWLKLLAPGLVDRIIVERVFRPIVERAKVRT